MAVALDLSKAFDSINHNFLLEKLKAYGFCESALSLMSSYLLGRKQRVCLHGVCSRFYADDTTLYASDASPIALQFAVNQGLSRLSEWFNATSC